MRKSRLPELPGLDPGIHLLKADGRARLPIHALVLDHCLGEQSDVLWIDSNGTASAHPLTKLAPSERALESVQVARAQTSYQHWSLINRARELVDHETALLTITGIDRFYLDHDRGNEDGQDVLIRGLARIAGVARDHDLPVLVSRCWCDEFSAPIENAADVIEFQETKMGPRFVAGNTETLVYPRRGGFQTTLQYWKRVLAARHPSHSGTDTNEINPFIGV